MPADAKYGLTWDLESLFPHPASKEFRREVNEFHNNLLELAERSEALPAVEVNETACKGWADFLADFEGVYGRAVDLEAYIGCHAAADAGNKLFQQFEAELAALRPLREQIATNIELMLKSADESTFTEFVQAEPRLERINYFLVDRRNNAALRLPKEQELLAAELAVDGLHAWGRLYDRISGDLRIPVMEQGEVIHKSPGQVQFDSAERTVRQNNFYSADKAWSTIADDCADALNHISGVRLTRYRRLGLTDHLDAPLRYNRMQRETLDAMWTAISQNKSVLLKYFSKKAELLGLRELSWYDVTAPLPKPLGSSRDQASAELTYDDACDLIATTFSQFSGEFGEFAQQAIERGWVEADNRAGKRQGGFCTGFPTKRESRIFMTFTNSADSMATLAHELGHAYHSYVLRDEPLFLQDYPMNLAETASTFAEAVLGEQRLNSSNSPAEQLPILDHMLGDATAFLMNIHARFLFEDEFHKERAEGELSAARFSELMVHAQKSAYLNGLADDGWNPNFWVSKLHFYISELPFYNFPYTFGYLLSLGAFALAKDVGSEFSDQYRSLLLATGCCDAEDAVAGTLGYDLSDAEFWNKSLEIVAERVDRFVEVADALLRGDR